MAKKHNWVTGPNHKVVDRKADKLASDFICSCNHLTPAAEAELDNLLQSMPRNTEEASNTVCEPDPDVLAMLDAPVELDELQPPAEAFEYDQRARASR